MDSPSFFCLYCGYDKPEDQESCEHAIPQFMGGEFAPQQYMLRNVCEQCNNRLGLFVDASYAKSWFVTNSLSLAAHKLYTGLADPALPLICMGLSNIAGLILDEGQVAEHWIGPSGETVIWLRANDERLHGYSGGNPIDKRKKPSTAYLCLTSQNQNRWEIGINSFLQMFKHNKVRKILCANVKGQPGGLPGFDVRTMDDEKNVETIMAAVNSGEVNCQMGVNLHFDRRFLAKITLGVGYSLFGDQYLETDIAREARRSCWPTDGEPGLNRGSTTFKMLEDPLFPKLIGYPGAVVFVVMITGSSYVLSVSIDQAIPFVVELAPSTLTSNFISREDGYTLVLFPSLGKAIEMTQTELIAHSSGTQKYPELEAIDARFQKSEEFWSQLAPI